MIIRSLALRDFRRFATFQTSFAPGFNVVAGDNEEGKSTLREAITLALFQDPKTSDRKILAQRRWGASEQFAIELGFEVNGKRYALAKDFQSKTARLEGLDSGERWQDARAIEAQMKQWLGLPSRALFESTVRIAQRDITRLQSGQEIADSLQRLLTGGEQDTLASRVLEELDKALAALRTAARGNPGPLHFLPGLIAEKSRASAEQSAALARANAAQRERAAKEEALAAVQESLALKEQRQRDCAERFRLEEGLRAAMAEEAALEARVDQARGLAAGAARAEQELAGYRAVLALPREQVEEIALLERQLATAPPPATNAPVKPPAPRRSLVLVGLVLVAAGLLLASSSWPLAAVCLLVGGGLTAWWLLRSRAGRVDAAALAAAMRAREQREAAASAGQRLGEMLAAVGCVSATELREQRRTAEGLRQRLAEARARLEGLLGGETVEGIEERRRAASRRARDLREQLAEPAMRLAELDQVAYQRLAREIAELRPQCDALRAACDELRVTILANRVSGDQLHALEEERQELDDRLGAARERERVLMLARRVLDEARTATMVSAKDVLEGELGGLLSEITRGRYRRVTVDAARLDIALFSPERAEPVAVVLDGELSTGTVEQIYLAARLALAKLLAAGRRPPLILDDPFVTFDAPRTAAVVALCKRLSAEHQVLLFTCKGEYEMSADRIISLREYN